MSSSGRRLPAFARVDRAEAVALLRELGIAVDLHCATFERAQAFVETLRGHAGREENLLYRWADDNLDRRYLTSIEAHLRATHTGTHDAPASAHGEKARHVS